MSKIIDTILLCALPASGKSETRKYLETRSPEECRENFHMGHTVQLDDYPYVHFMRCVDQESVKLGQERRFFVADDKCFMNGFDWGTLISLINEDYDDLFAKKLAVEKDGSAAEWLMDRLDAARKDVGQDPIFEKISPSDRKDLATALEKEAAIILKNKNAGIPESLEGKTVVIEFARGGKDKSTFPLDEPFGYQYSFSRLSDVILKKAAVLYVWVTPEGSRKKNRERADPNNPGSILFHGVPEYVMYNDYGCDDIDFLLKQSDTPDTVKIKAKSGNTFYIPLGRFDNRNDLTSFARIPVDEWKPEDTELIRAEMASAFSGLITQYLAMHK